MFCRYFNIYLHFFKENSTIYYLPILEALREETWEFVHLNWDSQLFFTYLRLYSGFVTVLWFLKGK